MQKSSLVLSFRPAALVRRWSRCIAPVLAGAALAGCSQTPPVYSWSHPASGEYLFAFDTRECEDGARDRTDNGDAALASPEFFSCMQERGYFLVDAQTGEILVAGSDSNAPAILSPQARR